MKILFKITRVMSYLFAAIAMVAFIGCAASLEIHDWSDFFTMLGLFVIIFGTAAAFATITNNIFASARTLYSVAICGLYYLYVAYLHITKKQTANLRPVVSVYRSAQHRYEMLHPEIVKYLNAPSVFDYPED